MSSATPPVMRVTRAAMWLGATLAVSACERSQDAATPAPSSNNTPANGAQPQLLQTQTTQTVQPNLPLQGPSIAPQQQSPQEQMLQQQPQPNAVPAYGAAPPVGPADNGSHARRYGAPAFVPWDEA